MSYDPTCHVCVSVVETILHVFTYCVFAKEVHRYFSRRLVVRDANGVLFLDTPLILVVAIFLWLNLGY